MSLADRTHVLPRITADQTVVIPRVTAEIIDHSPGCLPKKDSIKMAACALVGFVVGGLMMASVLAVAMFG